MTDPAQSALAAADVAWARSIERRVFAVIDDMMRDACGASSSLTFDAIDGVLSDERGIPVCPPDGGPLYGRRVERRRLSARHLVVRPPDFGGGGEWRLRDILA